MISEKIREAEDLKRQAQEEHKKGVEEAKRLEEFKGEVEKRMKDRVNGEATQD